MDKDYSSKFFSQKLGIREGLLMYFAQSSLNLIATFPVLRKILSKNGSLWIAWPKKASGIKSDLNENFVRKIGLNNGLVDIKVISVDDSWSALKFVYRLKDR